MDSMNECTLTLFLIGFSDDFGGGTGDRNVGIGRDGSVG